jgi:hypothetical protein
VQPVFLWEAAGTATLTVRIKLRPARSGEEKELQCVGILTNFKKEKKLS